MLNVAITFDYELFFGKNNATSEEILFSPTNELLDLLDKYGVKATFFADVLSVYMHTKEGLNDYSTAFTEQIKDMIARGHDVQLHIHSNWLQSKYNGVQWDFDTNSYRIHTFGFNKDSDTSAHSIINWGKEYLENTLKPINPNYRCIAFRAGGYCVQPHNELFKALKENGIHIDSSVVFKQKANGVNLYDFTDLPERYGWLISADSPMNYIAENGENAIFEIPIASIKNSLLRRLFCKNTERQLPRGEIKGTFIGNGKVEVPKKISKVKKLFNYNKQYKFLTVDSVSYKLLMRKLKKIVNKNTKKPMFVATIGHPKLISNVWLQNFEGLLTQIQKEEKICAVTMQDVIKKLGL